MGQVRFRVRFHVEFCVRLHVRSTVESTADTKLHMKSNLPAIFMQITHVTDYEIARVNRRLRIWDTAH
jgi:hypothetical protein